MSKHEEKDLKGKLVIDGCFEWWSKKDEANVLNYGYSFKEITPVFNDPFFFEMYDRKHSTDKQTRYFGLGSIADKFLVLQVSFTDEGTFNYGSGCDTKRTEGIL